MAAPALARLLELDPEHVLPLLDAVLASPDANVRRLGVETLPRPAHARPHPPPGRAAERPAPGRPRPRRQALRELAAQPEWTDGVVREAVRVLAGSDWRGLEQAALLLGRMDYKPAAGRLMELLRHDRPEVFVTAAWGVRRLAVPARLPAVLAYVEEQYEAMFAAGPAAGRPPAAAEAVDEQLSQLAQLLGRARYRPADALFRRLAPRATPAGNPAGPEARAAAIWALGLIHEGAAPRDLVGPLVGRLSAVGPPDVESSRVRRMAAVSLGRMKAADALAPLREFRTQNKPSADVVNNACGWAIEQITGEKFPAPGVLEVTTRNWFLSPLD